MKLVLYLFFLEIFLFACNSKPKTAQKKKNEQSIILAPDNSPKFDEIGFACYEDGSQSPLVEKFSIEISKKNYDFLKTKLFSSKSGEIYLATITCQKLSTSGVLKLTKNEENQLKINQLKKDSLSTCSGCTDFQNFTIHNLINDKNNYIGNEAFWWLEKTIKKAEH